jgi:hypothetical protein
MQASLRGPISVDGVYQDVSTRTARLLFQVTTGGDVVSDRRFYHPHKSESQRLCGPNLCAKMRKLTLQTPMRLRRPTSNLSPTVGSHILVQGDSTRVRFCPTASLVLTCPPFFHPRRSSSAHGQSPPIRDLDEFALWTAHILDRASACLSAEGLLCFVKTDVRYRSSLLPIGFKIADAVSKRGLRLRAHWVWQRQSSYSPYSPSIGNIFVFGNRVSSLASGDLFLGREVNLRRGHSTSYTPGLFEALLRNLTRPGEAVVDPFAGQGSLIRAAASCGRWTAGVEISRAQILKAEAQLVAVPQLEVRRL